MLGMRRHDSTPIFRYGIVEVGLKVAGRKPGEIFDFCGQVQLPQRQSALDSIGLVSRVAFDHQWLEVGPGGVNGGGPAGGSGTDYDDFFRHSSRVLYPLSCVAYN